MAEEKEGGSLSVSSNLKQVKWQKEPHGSGGTGLSEEGSAPRLPGSLAAGFFCNCRIHSSWLFQIQQWKESLCCFKSVTSRLFRRVCLIGQSHPGECLFFILKATN